MSKLQARATSPGSDNRVHDSSVLLNDNIDGSVITKDRGVGINYLSPTSESIVYRTGAPLPVNSHRASVLHEEKAYEVYGNGGQSRNDENVRLSCPSFVVDKPVDESIEGGIRTNDETSGRPAAFCVPTLGTDAHLRDGGATADQDS